MPSPVLSKLCANDAALGAADVRELVTRACPARDYSNKKVLLIVPDATRTAPVDLCFKALHEQLAGRTAAFDVMVALGTHQPMTEKAICDRLGISLEERSRTLSKRPIDQSRMAESRRPDLARHHPVE